MFDDGNSCLTTVCETLLNTVPSMFILEGRSSGIVASKFFETQVLWPVDVINQELDIDLLDDSTFPSTCSMFG